MKNENKTLDPEMEKILKGVMDSLTGEQKEIVNACKDRSELCDALEKMGVALPDELMDTVAGGKPAFCGGSKPVPRCCFCNRECKNVDPNDKGPYYCSDYCYKLAHDPRVR